MEIRNPGHHSSTGQLPLKRVLAIFFCGVLYIRSKCGLDSIVGATFSE